MSEVTLFIRHKTLPGLRDQVRVIWEKHMAPAIAANPGHIAYYYGFDTADPDAICAFQRYASAEAAEQFLKTRSYAEYLRDVEPLLAGPPHITSLLPIWSKT